MLIVAIRKCLPAGLWSTLMKPTEVPLDDVRRALRRPAHRMCGLVFSAACLVPALGLPLLVASVTMAQSARAFPTAEGFGAMRGKSPTVSILTTPVTEPPWPPMGTPTWRIT